MNPTAMCPDCDASLDEVSPGEPCPDCGGTRRSARIMGAAAISSTMVFTATTKVMRQDSPHWTQLWAQIERRILRLRSMYEPGGVSNTAELEDELDAFLTACFHLSDWLRHIKLDDTDDEREREHLETWKRRLAKAVDRFMKNPDMALCQDYANTFKHYDRGCPTDRIARLMETATAVAGVTVLVASWPADDPKAKTYVDGLELAEKCYAAWVGFLKRRELTQ